MTENKPTGDQHTSGEKNKQPVPDPLRLAFILRAFSSLGPFTWLVVFANLLCFGSVAANMAMIQEVKGLVDRPGLLTADIVTALSPLFVYCLINRICGGGQWLVNLYACNRAMANLRKRFFAKLQTLSSQFYDTHKSGWLVARNTGDMNIIGNFINFALMLLVIFLTSMGFAVYEIGRITPLLLLPCLLVMPIVFVFALRFKGRMSTAQRDSRAQNSRIVADLAETARGIRVVHAFDREAHNLKHFTSLSQRYYDLGIDVARLQGLFMPSVDFIGVFSLVLVMVFGSWLIHSGIPTAGGAPLTAGELAATLLYMNAILWPMRMLVEIYSLALQASAAAERIFEIIDLEPGIRDMVMPPARFEGALKGRILLEDVSFRYGEGQPWVLRNLSLQVEPGTTVAFVGPTGAGKTTIASLIGRYYDVCGGRVTIDGRDVREVAQDDLRRRMGVVLQASFFFTGSVYDNLALPRPGVGREVVEEIARALGTHEAIMALPDGYDTAIREGGESLSLGQRQLLALTRALVADPEVLILDEPTSSLDVYSERIVQAALEEITRNRTTVVIAHRLSTVRHAERILVIDDHRVIEEGTHHTLLTANGPYAAMVARSLI